MDFTDPKDSAMAEIVRIDMRVERHRAFCESAEAELFSPSADCKPERRKALIFAIALRDEMIEELMEKRARASQILRGSEA
jgi:hypothetical protein